MNWWGRTPPPNPAIPTQVEAPPAVFLTPLTPDYILGSVCAVTYCVHNFERLRQPKNRHSHDIKQTIEI